MIDGVLSQLTLNDSSQWHLVTFFSWKMILMKIRYEIYDNELLTIIEIFKTWRYYLKISWHKVHIFNNYNNLQRFMDTKSLSSKQVCWAQNLSHYHFQIDYCQGKANRAADALFQYPQQNVEKEKTLQAENIKIFYYPQLSLAKISDLFINYLSFFHQILICRKMLSFIYINSKTLFKAR